MKDDSAYQIFNTLSRMIIVFSIVILIAGLIMKFRENKPKKLSYETNVKTAAPTPPSGQLKISTIAAELNLKGPFVCHYSTPQATLSGYIKDKNIYGRIEEASRKSNVLLNGDCVYFWQSNVYVGEKLCGISPYISLVERLPISSLIGNSQLTSLLGNFNPSQTSLLPVKTDSIYSVINSCRKEVIQNESIFKIPANVLFKERK